MGLLDGICSPRIGIIYSIDRVLWVCGELSIMLLSDFCRIRRCLTAIGKAVFLARKGRLGKNTKYYRHPSSAGATLPHSRLIGKGEEEE